MRYVLLFTLMLVVASVAAQEPVTLKFTRPSKVQASASKIKLKVQGNEYVLKNGASISINVTPEYGKSLLINAGDQTAYYLKPKPGETYEFEVGFKFAGPYILLLSGEEAKPGEAVQVTDTTAKPEGWETNLKVDRDNMGAGITLQKTDQSEAIRQEWLARGGKIKYQSVVFNGTYFGMDMDMEGVDANRIDGYGGGISFYQNRINLKIPAYKTGASSWNSFNIGFGYDMLVYAYKFDMKMDPITTKMDVVTITMPFSANIGWTLGLGKFIDEGNWKGVALTLRYRPSIMFNFTNSTVKMTSTDPHISGSTSTSTDSNVHFNAVGVGFEVDFSNFSSTMEKLAPKPKLKLSFFVMPPVKDMPLFISFGLGITTYSR
jgi:hypothetical protein